jgi:purine-binding chemotaxis protein CheW
MGRMASARKRAHKDEAGNQPTPSVVPPAVEETILADDETASEPPIPETPSSPPHITLPSSGLAEEILAREDTRAIEPSSADVVDDAALARRPQSLSFLMAPAREEKKTVEATEHLVTFVLGEEEYGLDVRLVQEIIRLTEITPVPRAPEFVKGVINLRGRIIPVVDLKRRLGLGEVDAESRAARIVVAKLRERLVGLLVDGASQVLKVPVSVIEPPPEEIVEVDLDYIRAVAKLEGRLIILMELSRVLGLEAPSAAVQSA